MDRADGFNIGYLKKAHGIRGDIKAQLDVQHPQDYLQMVRVFVWCASDGMQEYPVERLRLTGSGADHEAILKLGGVDSREAADALRGGELWLPIEALPALESETGFYYYEVIGATLIDEIQGEVGTITDVLDMPGQDLLQVQRPDKREVLVPITDDFIGAFDREAKSLKATLPDGLLDL